MVYQLPHSCYSCSCFPHLWGRPSCLRKKVEFEKSVFDRHRGSRRFPRRTPKSRFFKSNSNWYTSCQMIATPFSVSPSYLGKTLVSPSRSISRNEFSIDIADQGEFQDELRNQYSSNPIAIAIPVATLLLLLFVFPSSLGKTLVCPQEGRIWEISFRSTSRIKTNSEIEILQIQ